MMSPFRFEELPAPSAGEKYFYICVACPYFCRQEEKRVVCPRCRLRLRMTCDCGQGIEDPTDDICARCGSLRREPAPMRHSAAGARMGARGRSRKPIDS